jgi:hypothetical protein
VFIDCNKCCVLGINPRECSECHGFSYFITVLSDDRNDIYYYDDYCKDDVTFLRDVIKNYQRSIRYNESCTGT